MKSKDLMDNLLSYFMLVLFHSLLSLVVTPTITALLVIIDDVKYAKGATLPL